MDLTPPTGRPDAGFYLGLAGACTVVALAGIPLLLWLVDHGRLPLWAHVPLALVALAAIGLGGLGAGVAWSAYRLQRQKEGPGAP